MVDRRSVLQTPKTYVHTHTATHSHPLSDSPPPPHPPVTVSASPKRRFFLYLLPNLMKASKNLHTHMQIHTYTWTR